MLNKTQNILNKNTIYLKMYALVLVGINIDKLTEINTSVYFTITICVNL